MIEEAKSDIDLGFFEFGETFPLIIFDDISFTLFGGFIFTDTAASYENLSVIWVDSTSETRSGNMHLCLLDPLRISSLKFEAFFGWVLAVDIFAATDVEYSITRQANHFVLA